MDAASGLTASPAFRALRAALLVAALCHFGNALLIVTSAGQGDVFPLSVNGLTSGGAAVAALLGALMLAMLGTRERRFTAVAVLAALLLGLTSLSIQRPSQGVVGVLGAALLWLGVLLPPAALLAVRAERRLSLAAAGAAALFLALTIPSVVWMMMFPSDAGLVWADLARVLWVPAGIAEAAMALLVAVCAQPMRSLGRGEPRVAPSLVVWWSAAALSVLLVWLVAPGLHFAQPWLAPVLLLAAPALLGARREPRRAALAAVLVLAGALPLAPCDVTDTYSMEHTARTCAAFEAGLRGPGWVNQGTFHGGLVVAAGIPVFLAGLFLLGAVATVASGRWPPAQPRRATTR